MSKKICGEIFGYVIRHPGEEGEMRYVVGKDPDELKKKFYEGFNPVCALVRLDTGRIFDTDSAVDEAQP